MIFGNWFFSNASREFEDLRDSWKCLFFFSKKNNRI